MTTAVERNSEGFPPAFRVRRPSDFQRVFRAPKWKFQRSELAVLVVPSLSPRESRLGLAISKKTTPLATQRNRIKRAVRESYRRNRGRMAGLDIVVTSRSGIATRSNSELFTALQTLWNDVARKCDR